MVPLRVSVRVVKSTAATAPADVGQTKIPSPSEGDAAANCVHHR